MGASANQADAAATGAPTPAPISHGRPPIFLSRFWISPDPLYFGVVPAPDLPVTNIFLPGRTVHDGAPLGPNGATASSTVKHADVA